MYLSYQFELGDEEEVERLKQLFHITQGLLMIKDAQLHVAEEELSDAAADVGKDKAQRGR